MKMARFVLKIVGFSLAAAAAICCIIGYWDKLVAFFTEMKESGDSVEASTTPSEYDDYADWDE